MSVRGISESYFAGMPTAQRDPRAGQMDVSYAQMPGQALTEANAMRQHRLENDQQNAFRAREMNHRESQDAASGARDDRRLAMYQQGEDRRQSQQQFENDRLKAADTRKLIEALQAATNAGEQGIAEALAAELQSRGWGVKPIGAQSAAPAQPTQQAAPSGTPAPKKPMSAEDQQTSRELDQAEANIIPKLRGTAPAPSMRPGDAALASQLDQAGDRYVRTLRVRQEAEWP